MIRNNERQRTPETSVNETEGNVSGIPNIALFSFTIATLVVPEHWISQRLFSIQELMPFPQRLGDKGK